MGERKLQLDISCHHEMSLPEMGYILSSDPIENPKQPR